MGNFRGAYSNDTWHVGPTIYAGGTITASRNNDGDIEGSVTNAYASLRSGSSYPYDIPVEINTASGRGSISITWTNMGTASGNRVVGLTGSGTFSGLSFSFKITGCPEAEKVRVWYVCGQTGGCSGHEQEGDGGANRGENSKGVDGVVRLCQVKGLTNNCIDISAAYKKPTLSFSGTNISVFDKNRNISIAANSNSDSFGTNVSVNVNGHSHSTSIGNSAGTYTFKPSDNGVKDGQSYKVTVTRTHTKKSDFTASQSKNFLTYRTPIIQKLKLSETSFSGFGNLTLDWETNGRRWTDTEGEKTFETKIKFNTDNTWFDSTDHTPLDGGTNNIIESKTQTLTEQHILNHFSETYRNQDFVETKLTMRRSNVSSEVNTDTDSVDITVQFTPKYEPQQIQYWDYDNTSFYNRGEEIEPNSMLYLDEHPQLLIDWSLPDKPDIGVIDGFKLTIYEDNTYENIFKTFTINSETHSQLYGQQQIDIRKDLKRGQTNYVGVKAFYNKPNGTTAYGPELKQVFILPIGKLYPPKIHYPIDNGEWHNKNFRILLELPFDDDYDVLEDIMENNTYRYKDLEVFINNVPYNFLTYPNTVSTEKLHYKDRICINPSLVTSFPNVNEYKIKIRVQKNYFVNVWSEYCTEITLNNTAVNNLTLNKEDYILATHYKYVRNASVRLYNVYPINTLPKDNVDQNVSDVIYAKHYQGIYDTILQIQKDVNEWATFDTSRMNVKFNQNINILNGSNKPQQDIITAVKDNRPTIQGRNYKNILIDCMNQLY